MEVIYEPKGKAKEYAELALNIYNGCTHSCLYCFVPQMLHIDRERFHSNANPKKDILIRAKKDIRKLIQKQEKRVIQLTFTGDCYQPDEMRLGITRQILEALALAGLNFTILTKGGMRVLRDFDILKSCSDRCSLGVTLTLRDGDELDWEPGAPSFAERTSSLYEAKKHGIKTWVSLEPAIDPLQTYSIINDLKDVVDHWKVGKLNYFPDVEKTVDWVRFREDLRELFLKLGITDYYLKKSLTELK